MPDIGASELLLILVVAILVIGPKDMPLAMRTAGRWIGKMRKLSGHFRAGMDAMIREAEMEEMEKKWAAQNERIMREHPASTPSTAEITGDYPAASAEPAASQPAPASSSSAAAKSERRASSTLPGPKPEASADPAPDPASAEGGVKRPEV